MGHAWCGSVTPCCSGRRLDTSSHRRSTPGAKASHSPVLLLGHSRHWRDKLSAEGRAGSKASSPRRPLRAHKTLWSGTHVTPTSPNPSSTRGTTVPPAAQQGPATPAIARHHTSFPSQQPPLNGTSSFCNSRQNKAKTTSLSVRYRHPLLPREAQGGNKLILHLPHHSKAREAAAACVRANRHHSNQHPTRS